MAKIAVLLVARGAPDAIDDIEPYLSNICGQKRLTQELIENYKNRYRAIGGKSPLLEITQSQARALENFLNTSTLNHHLSSVFNPDFALGSSPPRRRGSSSRRGLDSRFRGNDGTKKSWLNPRRCLANAKSGFKVYIAMAYWRPFIQEALKKAIEDGTKRLIVLALAPQYSLMSVGAYFKKIEEEKEKLKASLKLSYVKSWPTNPYFLKALAEQIKKALNLFTKDEQKNLEFIFTVHSLPVRALDNKDPYIKEGKETASCLAQLLNLKRYHLAYQSRSPLSRETWLNPSVEEVLNNLSQGRPPVLIVPVGFVSDHLETVYDIDICFKREAQEKGIHLERIPSLNDSLLFIQALASLVEEEINRG